MHDYEVSLECTQVKRSLILHIGIRLGLIGGSGLVMALIWGCGMAWMLSVGMGMGDSPGVDHTATRKSLESLYTCICNITNVLIFFALVTGLDMLFLDNLFKVWHLPNIRQRVAGLVVRYACLTGVAVALVTSIPVFKSGG